MKTTALYLGKCNLMLFLDSDSYDRSLSPTGALIYKRHFDAKCRDDIVVTDIEVDKVANMFKTKLKCAKCRVYSFLWCSPVQKPL